MTNLSNLTKVTALLVAAVLLAGCPKDRVGYGITCPPLLQYSDEFMDKTLAEVEIIEKTAPHVVTMFNDYGVTRDSIRTCIAKQKDARKKKKP